MALLAAGIGAAYGVFFTLWMSPYLSSMKPLKQMLVLYSAMRFSPAFRNAILFVGPILVGIVCALLARKHRLAPLERIIAGAVGFGVSFAGAWIAVSLTK
jgi:hypothetical protein